MSFQKKSVLTKRNIILEMIICPIDGILKTVESCYKCDDLKAEDTRHVYCEHNYVAERR